MQASTLDRISRVVEEVARGSDLDRALAFIADQIAADLGAPTCKIWVVKRGDICDRCPLATVCSNRQMCMHLTAASGASIEKEYPRIPLSLFNASLIARGGTSDFTDPGGPGEKLFGLQHGVSDDSRDSYALYPLRGTAGILGLIGIFNHRPIEESEIEALAHFAPVGVAVIRVAELRARYSSLRNQLGEKASAAESARGAASRERQLEETIALLTAQVGALQTRADELQAERDLIQGIGDEATRRADRLENENRGLHERWEELISVQKESGRLYSEMTAQLESDRNQVEQENAWLKGRLAGLEQNVVEMNRLREVLMNELAERNRAIDGMRAEIETRDADIQQARQVASSLEEQINFLDQANVRLGNQCAGLAESVGELERSLQMAEEGRARLENGRASIEERVAELIEELDRARAENRRLLAENERALSETQTARAQLGQLRKVAEERASLNALNSELTQSRARAEDRVRELEEENAALSQANSQLEDAVKQFETLAARLEESALKLRDRAEATERIRIDLEQRNRVLSEQCRRLQNETQAKARFLANMSHELRTPMNAIIGFTSLLLEDAALHMSDRHRRSLERVSRNARDLLQLINNVLDLSKIDAGRMDVFSEPADVRDLVERAITVVEPLKQGRPIELTLQIQDGLPTMRTDRTKLQQVLINLLSNAIKFTPEGVIKIAADRLGPDRVRIAVSDMGIGIAESDIPHIFQEFRQVSSSNRKAPASGAGTGLGLPITRRLVDLLGGKISVSSRVGEGSVFAVMLPIEIEGRAAPAFEVDYQPSTPERTALVIDADPASLFITKKYLTEAGYSVAATDDPSRGLEIARVARPAVITIDIDLTEGGISTLEQLARENGPETLGENASTIVALSAAIDSPSSDALQLVLNAGAAAFLRKPIDRADLLRVLKRAATPSPRSVLVVDDDPDALDLVLALLEGSGYEARTATNGREALQEIGQARPDVIILDLMLPEMDGFEVVHRLSLNQDWRTIPVILVTARDLSHEERRALDLATTQIIQKGNLSRDELLAGLSSAMGMSAAHSNQAA